MRPFVCRVALYTSTLWLVLAGFASSASAATYEDSQEQTFSTAAAEKTFRFEGLPPARGEVEVTVELWGDYGPAADRPKFATVTVDGASETEVCRSGCKPTCNSTAHRKSVRAPSSTVADGVVEVVVSNSESVQVCRQRNAMRVALRYESNPPPTADDLEYQTDEDEPVDITLEGSDPDGDDLVWEIVEPPEHGTLEGEAPDLTYRPEADFNGEDAFRYTVSDGTTRSDPATVALIVEPVDDPPTWVTPSVREWKQEVGETLKFDAEATDPDDEVLSYGIDGAPEGHDFSESGRFRWTPTADQVGTHAFEVTASDGTHTIRRELAVEVLPPDSDDDGWRDPEDNCPETANRTQRDTDGDGRGDACDPCPEHDVDAGSPDACPAGDAGSDVGGDVGMAGDVGVDVAEEGAPAWSVQGGGCSTTTGRSRGFPSFWGFVAILVVIGLSDDRMVGSSDDRRCK